MLFKGISNKGTVLHLLSSSAPFYRAVPTCAGTALLVGTEGKESSIRNYTPVGVSFYETRGLYKKKNIISRIPYPPIIKTGGRGYVNMHVKKKSKFGL